MASFLFPTLFREKSPKNLALKLPAGEFNFCEVHIGKVHGSPLPKDLPLICSEKNDFERIGDSQLGSEFKFASNSVKARGNIPKEYPCILQQKLTPKNDTNL